MVRDKSCGEQRVINFLWANALREMLAQVLGEPTLTAYQIVTSDKYAIAVPVETGQLTPETMLLIQEVKLKADAGDVEWLKKHGKVYQLIE